MLNTYRCLFDVDTEIVPDGCRGEDERTEETVDRPVPTGNTGRIGGAILTTKCNDDRPRGGTLTIGVPYGMKGWDPTLDDGSHAPGATRMTALYDALFYLDLSTGQLVPGLAESITTDDNQVFTLKLREGINFTDGTRFDADAFVWNVKHHQNPAARSVYAYQASQFSILTRRALTNTSFGSKHDLVEVIDTWTSFWNDNPEPFIWTTNAQDIIAKVRRGRAALNDVTNSATHN